MNWLPLCNFGLQIVTIIVLSACFVKVMKNDLSHLQKDTAEIKETLEKHSESITEIKVDVAHLKGKFCKVSRKK